MVLSLRPAWDCKDLTSKPNKSKVLEETVPATLYLAQWESPGASWE